MSEPELRAWSLVIAALVQKEKSSDFAKLLKVTETITAYIKTGKMPPEKDFRALYES